MEVIDEQKRREKKLLYLSETDSMTGINNRGSGERKITEFLEKKKGGLFCLLDCDKFKKINDTYEDYVKGLIDRLKAVCEVGKDYKSFSGLHGSMNGEVKFVIETAAIEKED